MDTKDLWMLLSGVGDDIEGVIQSAPPELRKELENANIILIEKVTTIIGSDGKLELFYNGKKLEPPRFFWPAMTNTDSYSFENILIEAGAECILNLNDVAAAHSKAISYERLASHGIRVPRSLIFYDRTDKTTITDTFTYPFVVKPDTGTGGAGVALIHNDEEMDAYLNELTPGMTYIAQEYIASSKGRDLRVVMLGGQCLFSMQRTAGNEKEFRSNVHAGGSAKAVEIDDATLALCRKIGNLYDLDLIGIDLLYGEDGFVVTEVNNFPGIRREFLPHLKPAGLHVLKTFIDRKNSEKA